MARPTGSKNLRLSLQDKSRYLNSLRANADKGDVDAMGWLLHLSDNAKNPQKPSGWKGDENDQYQNILSEIRRNDPRSQQLPENK